MHFRIQIITVTEEGMEHRQEIAEVLRSKAQSETIGLTLEENKEMLHKLQQTMVAQQVTAYLEQQRPCPHCLKQRPLKERQTAPFRTLFGTIQVPRAGITVPARGRSSAPFAR